MGDTSSKDWNFPVSHLSFFVSRSLNPQTSGGIYGSKMAPSKFQVTKKTKQSKPVQEDLSGALPLKNGAKNHIVTAWVCGPPPSNSGTRRVLLFGIPH